MYLLKRIPIVINTLFTHLAPKMIHGLVINEAQFKKKIKKKLQALNWMDIKLHTKGYAANWSFLYLLLKFITEKQPDNLLELGSGQTSKLIYNYILENNNKTALVLEDYKNWYDEFKPNFNSPRFEYLYKPLNKQLIGEKEIFWYSFDFNDIEKFFNLIVIDGPAGSYNYSRLGISKYLTSIISSEDFLIIMDDSERRGERQTLEILKKKLTKANISFHIKHIYGRKRQTCLYSYNHQEFFKEF
jgi:hypothetical protein